MKNFWNKYKFQILLTIIVGVLFLANYKSGTYLSGWDNLQTELNPGLAVKRAFFSVWEEYQSFGLTAGMAHAADLPRAIFLWLASFVIPQNMIRYFYHFLMLLVGGLGAFTLFKDSATQILSHESLTPLSVVPSKVKNLHSPRLYPSSAFLASLFYMLNLGTVQIFYLPFESFSTFFAFLPWGIWIFKKILTPIESGQISKRDVLLFLLINVLGTPAFYTQQLFVVYMLVLGCVSIGLMSQMGQIGMIRKIKKIILAFLLILIINSFWILPQIYFLKNNDGWIAQAKANQLATEDTLYQNLEKGTLNNFFRLEGFYFDLKGSYGTYLFAPWRDHFDGVFRILQYLIGLIALIGLIRSIGKHKNAGFLLIFLLCATALLLATPPFSWINDLVRQIPIINQIFRSPFTKFIIPYSLVYSFFVARGIQTLVPTQSGDTKKKLIYWFIGLLLILYALPAFQGYFFSPEMKTKIPEDYFQVMDYFKNTDKNKRIALLPDYTFWGWFYNKWGYNGSGFLWYGIEQPIVSRTFDVWSPKSESYFWEQKQALEAENITQYEQVLDKYNIDYLVVDNSLVPLTSNYKSLGLDRIEKILINSQKISPILRGENISLYQVNHSKKIQNFVSISSNLKNIGPEARLLSDDQAYFENGDYMTKSLADIYYPFASLMTQTRINNKNWNIEEKNKLFSISSNIDLNQNQYKLNLKSTSKADVSSNQKSLELNLNPSFENNKITVSFEKSLIKTFDLSKINNNPQEFTLLASDLPQKYSYLIKIKSRNVSGSQLFFYVLDETKKQSMIEEKLRSDTEYFILPHKFDYGLGYSLVFQNKSYINYPSENYLEEVSIYLFPYEELKSAKFVKNNLSLIESSFSDNFEAKKINYFTYKTTINPSASLRTSNLILYQSYSPGWIAFSSGKLLEHVKVNNWSNGWILTGPTSSTTNVGTSRGKANGSTVTIVFWPQYLEFLGFALLAIAIFRILIIKEKHE